ncbi:thermonuclease family protein [Breoghania corrubedonensis]|uniref:thermonuclease family protein n=1 Tax=Breoghania corrubedonensis TaxID=665038 RepID=UPI0011B26554
MPGPCALSTAIRWSSLARCTACNGIDAPEAGQTCKKLNGGTRRCGQAAIKAMEDLVVRKEVACDRRDQDLYGRTVGVGIALCNAVNLGD